MAAPAKAMGSPPITTPGAVNLPVLQQLASNIRERIQRIEAQLPGASVAQTLAQSTPSDSSSLQRQIAGLRADVDRLLATTGGSVSDQLLLLIPSGDTPAAPDAVSQVLAARVFGA